MPMLCSNMEQWRIQRVYCPGGGGGGNEIGAKRRLGKDVEGGYHSCRFGPGGAFPGNIFDNWMQMVHSEPFFCRIRVDFSPKILCKCCLQSSDIRDAGEFSP